MKRLFNDIYKGKKVLITGNTGFKGSWLSLWLSKMGASVIGYSLDVPSIPNHHEVLGLELEQIWGNIIDKGKVAKIIKANNPDIIFHLAAQPIVRLSYKEPVKTMETNIMGTINVLEGCRKSQNIKAVVVITSDKCYRNQEIIWGYRESDPMGGNDPYSASKGCAELIVDSYRQSFFNPDDYRKKHLTLIASARAGNVVGGGDWAVDRLVPDMVRAADANNKVINRNPNAVRPWQHVLEPLSGYLKLGEKLLEGKKEFAEGWNFGPSPEFSITVQEALDLSKKYWDKIKYEIHSDTGEAHEANILKLDSTKARQKLKWENVWNLNQTFEKTIDWYKNYYQNSKILTENDLGSYTQALLVC